MEDLSGFVARQLNGDNINCSRAKQETISVLGLQVTQTAKQLVNVMNEYIVKDKTNMFSTSQTSENDFLPFQNELEKELDKFDIQNSLVLIGQKIDSPYLQRKFTLIIPQIIERIHHVIDVEFEKAMDQYAINEMDHIKTCINGESVFNLSDQPVSDDIKEWIQHGPKYNPYVKKPNKQLLREFDLQFVSIINRLVKYHRVSHIISLKNIEKDIVHLTQGSRSPKLKTILTQILKDYKHQRILFKRHIKIPSTNLGNVVSEKRLENIFEPKDGRIIVCADKNLGFCLLNIDDYKKQYLKINQQQNFAKTEVNEEWYISNIKSYLQEVKDHLPKQLSRILKASDFEFVDRAACIGSLRLLPKVLKLKTVDYEHVNELKSRGIKSSLHDPIRAIQNILDKIFSHLFYFIEKAFHEKYGLLSPSVSGITEALDRMKLEETGAWGHSVELEADFTDLYRELLIYTYVTQ